MPRYYFNVIAGDGAHKDLEGSDLLGLDQARAEAIEDARSLMSDAIIRGEDISSRRLEICDDDGEVLFTVPFKDVRWTTLKLATSEASLVTSASTCVSIVDVG